MATRIGKKDFKEKVVDNSLPVLVEFYSDSCVACKKIAPVLYDIQDDYEGKIDIYKVNTGYEQELAQEYKVLSNPTLILFVNGKEAGKQIGAKDYDDLADWLDSNI